MNGCLTLRQIAWADNDPVTNFNNDGYIVPSGARPDQLRMVSIGITLGKRIVGWDATRNTPSCNTSTATATTLTDFNCATPKVKRCYGA